jgi:hypothetical protein
VRKGNTFTIPIIGQANPLVVNFSTFIGESSNAANSIYYRATVTGPAPSVSSATNEGIWLRTNAGATSLLLRKGTSIQDVGTVGKILAFWGAPDDQLMVRVELTGGVTASNNEVLLLRQPSGTFVVLAREGDPAPGCPGTTLGTFQRVEVDSTDGTYAILAPLVGAASDANLALFTGNITRGNTTNQATLRRPFLRLRKGQVFANQPSKIKTITLPLTVTPSGAGSTGIGRAISSDGDLVFTLEFLNGVQQVVKGTAF